MSQAPIRRIGLIVFALAALGGLGVLFTTRITSAMRRRAAAARPVQPALPVVRVEPVAVHDLDRVVVFTGTIRPHNRVDIFTHAPGRIEQMLVHTGDRVRAGQVLAVVDHRVAAWQNAQAAAQMAAASAGVEQARVGREAALRETERLRGLRASQSVAQADLDRVEAQLHNADAAYRTALAQVGVARAAAGLVGESLRNTRVVTPIDGTVTRSTADIGTEVNPAMPFMEIQDVATLKLQGAVPAEDFLQLRVGQAVEISVETIDHSVPGVVATLSPALDPATRRAAVEIAVDNPDTALLPNMFATVRVSVGHRTGVLAIPAGAVVETAVGRAVFVYRDGRAIERHPRFGTQVGDLLPVEDMAPSELLIVSGQTTLMDQERVEVVSGDTTAREARR